METQKKYSLQNLYAVRNVQRARRNTSTREEVRLCQEERKGRDKVRGLPLNHKLLMSPASSNKKLPGKHLQWFSIEVTYSLYLTFYALLIGILPFHARWRSLLFIYERNFTY